MYYIRKQVTVAASHCLPGYQGKCSALHGHNWQITVFCKSEVLDDQGMVVDFATISNVCAIIDHKNLNDVLGFMPTAENLAKWLCTQVPQCYRVEVEETPGNTAIYEEA